MTVQAAPCQLTELLVRFCSAWKIRHLRWSPKTCDIMSLLPVVSGTRRVLGLRRIAHPQNSNHFSGSPSRCDVAFTAIDESKETSMDHGRDLSFGAEAPHFDIVSTEWRNPGPRSFTC